MYELGTYMMAMAWIVDTFIHEKHIRTRKYAYLMGLLGFVIGGLGALAHMISVALS